MLSTFLRILMLAATFEIFAGSASAQPAADRPEVELLKKLVGEIQQLRSEMRFYSTTSYRSQGLVERLRLHQEQVNRLRQELEALRIQISNLRSERAHYQDQIAQLESRDHPDVERIVDATKESLSAVNRTEAGLLEKEARLVEELKVETEKLNEMNRRLDDIDKSLADGIVKQPSAPSAKLKD